jgi:putative ABC transport system substrate-binding protein
MKRFLAAVVAVTTALALTACGSSSTNTTTDDKSAESTDDTTYKIGVLQLTQHAALDKANEGFIAALDESGIKYEVDQQNASGEQSACQTIAEKLVNDGNDLIYAIATPAAQAVAGVTSEIPIVLSAVTDPAESGLVASNDAPGGNVTGTSDLTPVKEQIELLKQILPDAKTVGILFCSSESNSEIQAAMAREACEANGLEHIDFTVSSSNEIQTVVESMVGKVDVIYAPTDNTIAAGMPTVSMIATDNGLPIICGEQGMVDAGGLATYGIDYYQLGYMAGQMAVEILRDGADPATMPIGYLSADQCELSVNDETAAALGIDVSGLKK